MPAPMADPLLFLRRVCLIEAVSYLLLCFVAMPLKYFWDMPLAVRVMGMIHGVLFLLMIWFLLRARIEKNWPPRRLWLVFGASFVWFWPFFLDRHVRQWIAETPAG